MNMDLDVPKYRKKKTSSKSHSSKRSDHKHDYEKVIIEGWLFGWEWGERCKICGRTEYVLHSDYHDYHDFLKEGVTILSSNESYWLSKEEIKEKYPGIPIFKAKRLGDYEPID